MTVEFFWREHWGAGGQIVAGSFESAVQAGIWRRDNPPVINGRGPTLIKLVDGEQVELEAGEYADCFTQFAPVEERSIDLTADAVRFP